MDLPDSECLMPLLLISLLILFVPAFHAFGQNEIQYVETLDDTSKMRTIDLLSPEYDWESVNRIVIERSGSDLNLKVDTDQEEEIYHRAVMQTHISGIPTFLKGEYSSRSAEGEAIYGISIRDLQNNSKWWTRLGNTGGQITNLSFQIPENLWNSNNNVSHAYQAYDFRLYIITEDPGDHSLNFRNLELQTSSPPYNSLATVMPWLFPSQ